MAFLSFAELDASGNVNVSRFGDRVIGFGGFINISQNTRKVIFSGTFTTGGLRLQVGPDKIAVATEGNSKKLVGHVRQISYSAPHGRERGQQVLYVTERAVFRLADRGLELIEIAPGIEIERDVFGQMGFRPLVAPDLRTMDKRLFRPEPMGLGEDIAAKAPIVRARRLAELDASRSIKTI
jgi:propionate CoA-transferase